MEDLVEVCSLSRQMIFQPVFAPLQGDLRFFHIPLPAAPTACFTAHLPKPAALRAYPVPHGFPNGSGSSISPAAPHPRGGIGKTPCLSAYLLVQACQHLWLGYFDDVYMRFTCVSRTRSSLAPLRLDAGRFSLASRFDLPKIGGYIVPRASDPAVTGRACLGRERVVEQSVPSGVNLRNRNPCDFQVALPMKY